MSRIKVLSPDLVNKIAAGEVIERPSSVVKELVENSIDAKAKKIIVNFTAGGRELIEVIDDGFGMTAAELKLAVQSHATSKINAIEDLLSINSLGFRGEALPSIAAVSKMKLISRPWEEAKGHALFLAGGKPLDFKAIGSPKGTRIITEELFYNTPARFKFLKDVNREASFIASQLIALALASVDVAFALHNNQKEVFKTSGQGEILKTWGEIFSHQLTQHFLEIKKEAINHVQIEGYLGDVPLSLSTTRGIQMFVNNRPFYSRQLLKALLQGYQEHLPPKRFPRALIYLTINPVHLDVNVHPAKKEISFGQIDQLAQILTQTVQNTLQKTKNIYSNISPKAVQVDVQEESINFPTSKLNKQQKEKTIPTPQEESLYQKKEQNKPLIPEILKTFQVHNSYLICEVTEGLLIIDQHGAHERILFNKLANQSKNDSPQQTPLLIPHTVELDPTAADLKTAIIQHLQQFGFTLEDFGPKTVVIREVPTLLPTKDRCLSIAEDLIQLFTADKHQQNIETLRRETLLTMACHHSIRFGKKLDALEIRKLLNDLFKQKNYTTCPHGRPIIKKLSATELSRFFSR